MIFNSIQKKIDKYARQHPLPSQKFSEQCQIATNNFNCPCVRHQQIYNKHRDDIQKEKIFFSRVHQKQNHRSKIAKINDRIQNNTRYFMKTGTFSCRHLSDSEDSDHSEKSFRTRLSKYPHLHRNYPQSTASTKRVKYWKLEQKQIPKQEICFIKIEQGNQNEREGSVQQRYLKTPEEQITFSSPQEINFDKRQKLPKLIPHNQNQTNKIIPHDREINIVYESPKKINEQRIRKKIEKQNNKQEKMVESKTAAIQKPQIVQKPIKQRPAKKLNENLIGYVLIAISFILIILQIAK